MTSKNLKVSSSRQSKELNSPSREMLSDRFRWPSCIVWNVILKQQHLFCQIFPSLCCFIRKYLIKGREKQSALFFKRYRRTKSIGGIDILTEFGNYQRIARKQRHCSEDFPLIHVTLFHLVALQKSSLLIQKQLFEKNAI
nr:12822_t:CDS:2 [Entrophospora candida]